MILGSGLHQHLKISSKTALLQIVDDDHFISVALVINLVVAALGSIFWGWIGDHVKYGNMLLFLTIIDIPIKLYASFMSNKA